MLPLEEPEELAPLELPELLLAPEEELLLEDELLVVPLPDELGFPIENWVPLPPQAARPKQNRTAAQAWAIV